VCWQGVRRGSVAAVHAVIVPAGTPRFP